MSGAERLRRIHLTSNDVVAAKGSKAANCRFRSWHEWPTSLPALELTLIVELDGGRIIRVKLPSSYQGSNPYHKLIDNFFSRRIPSLGAGKVLELGSRARSGIARKNLVIEPNSHVGIDIKAGPGVDIIGDAHELSSFVAEKSCIAVFSISVFEHLLMPWKVAVELNRVLQHGGLVMVATHQSWPLHDQPWDFWRFSDQSWRALFNADTGFEVIDTALGSPASVVPHWTSPSTHGLDQRPAFTASAVIAKKISDTSLNWNVKTSSALESPYPH